MNYSTLYPTDMVNGEGVRVSLFLSCCDHGCRGCFNQKAWNPNYGKPYTKQLENDIINLLNDLTINRTGLSLLGGDPLFHQNVDEVFYLMRRVKSETSKTIWLWSGYTLEEMKDSDQLRPLLPYIDVLIDGKFEEDKKDLNLPFRGSSNQRILKLGVDY